MASNPSRPFVRRAQMTAELVRSGVEKVAALDPDLAALYERNGVPPLWMRPSGFATMVLFILEQQVSLASAAAAFAKLEAAVPAVMPEHFLSLGDDELRAIGFSRQKAGYCRDIALGILEGDIALDGLALLDYDAARAALLAIRGVGPWTADVYLLLVLGSVDAWPSGDRALIVAMERAKPSGAPLDVAMADDIAQAWRPWRAMAARMLWHEYLGGRDYFDTDLEA